MSNYLNVPCPTFWAFMDTGFRYNELPDIKRKRVCVEVFSVVSIPERCLMFMCMDEQGALATRVPIHYMHTEPEGGDDYPLDWLELWNPTSYYASVTVFDYLKNRAVDVMLKDKTRHRGVYMFTVDNCLGPQYSAGYGEMAAGHKQLHIIRGRSRIFAQPANRVLFFDGGSFIGDPLKAKPDWEVFSHEFSCEQTASRWVSEVNEEAYFYEFKEHAKTESVVSKKPGKNH